MTKDPQTVTIRGRLSYPTWTTEAAFALAAKGKFPTKSPEESTPSFQLLVEKDQLDKLMLHVKNEFLPWVVANNKAGEKRNELEQDEVNDLLAQLDNRKKWAKPTFNTPFKEIGEKTVDLVPECVAAIAVRGSKGQNIDLKAVVENESELLIPDADILGYPVLRSITQTVHEMYAGAMVAATLNLYSYRNGNNPGFSAGANTAVFKADAERLGGGVAVDEDEIFLD